MNNDTPEKVFGNENVNEPAAAPQQAPAFTDAPSLDEAPMLQYDTAATAQGYQNQGYAQQQYYDPNAQQQYYAQAPQQQYAQPQQGYYDPNAGQGYYAQPQQGYYTPAPQPQSYYNSEAQRREIENETVRKIRREGELEAGQSRATRALVWGIISIVTFGYTAILSWIFAGIAISNAKQSKAILNDAGYPTSGKARAGYILAQIVNVTYTTALIVAVVFVLILVIGVGSQF